MVPQPVSNAMQCHIYRSTRREGLYIYLPDADAFANIPELVARKAGKLEFSMQIELSENSRLRRENPATVIANLQQQGYHLQIPETVESLLDRHKNLQQ